MSQDTWRITAVDAGTSIIEKSILTYLTDPGVPIRIPRVMWCLEGSSRHQPRILVDTSPDNEEVARTIIGENLSRTPDQEPAAALRGIGVDPATVDVVLFTHLHWDHCGNLHLFPNARLLAQRDEIAYASHPSPYFARAFLSATAGYTPPYYGRRLEALVGDVEPWPGVQIMHVPGHTPGSQAVRVKTRQGWVTIAGDAVFTYENLEKDIPPGFHMDVDASLLAMRRIREASDLVLPSHDYRVFGDARVRVIGA